MTSSRIALFAAVVFLSAAMLVHAQEPAQAARTDAEKAPSTISGTVRATDGSVLPGAEVSIKGTKISTTTDETGTFALAGAPAGEVILAIALSGFGEQEIKVRAAAGETVTLNVVLDVKELSFQIMVSAAAPKLMQASENLGVLTVSPREMAVLPNLGEKDIFRSLQLLPGISMSNESSSGLYIRGGTPDQNLVLFDGFTAYDVDHFFGIFSAFNANAIEKITLHKGGFESRYGGRLSSVLDMTGRSRFPEKTALGGGMSFLSYNGYAAFPLGSRGSFLLAGRKSFQSPFSDRIRDSYTTNTAGGGPMSLSFQPTSAFYDVNAKGTYSLSSRDDISVSGYNGADDLDGSRGIPQITSARNTNQQVSGEINNLSRWGNTGASFLWDRRWNDAFFSTLTLAHSRYFRDQDRTSNITLTDTKTGKTTSLTGGSCDENNLRDATIGLNGVIAAGRSHLLEAGVSLTRLDVDYGFTFLLPQRITQASDQDATSTTNDRVELKRADRADQYAVYLQDTWSLSRRIFITPGFRATYFENTKGWYGDPRLAVNFHLTDSLRLKAAGGQYHQFARNLVREDPFQGNQEFWTLSDGDTVPVGSAVHAIAGVSYETPDFLVDVEAYRKEMKGLSELASVNRRRPGSGGSLDFTFGNLLYKGTGTAQGVDFLVQKKTGNNTGWLSYTAAKVEHAFPQFSTLAYPASHDSTHEFKIVDTHRYKRLVFSATWVYATGKPYTEASGTETITLPNGRIFDRVEMGPKNGARMPDYHRLDVSATWDFYRGESNKASAGVSVFNAYNRPNVWRKEYTAAEGEIITTDVNYLAWTISAFVNVDLSVPDSSRRAGPAWYSSEIARTARSKRDPNRIYDFYGKVESIDADSLTVSTRQGGRKFLMEKKTIKGSDLKSGALVHLFYRDRGDAFVVAMVFEKIDDWKKVAFGRSIY